MAKDALDTAVVGQPLAHESAAKQVNGQARYVDDLPEYPNQLHLAFHLASIARGKIVSVDTTAATQAPDVVAVFSLADVPGKADIGPVFGGDPLLADGEILFWGQPVVVVAATAYRAAQQAAALVKVEYAPEEAVLDIDTALQQQRFTSEPHRFSKGDSASALATSPLTLEGEISIGGQDHLYLEGQVSSARYDQDAGLHVISSTQNPTELQHQLAHLLALPLHQVVVEVRRMGGAFGGKETQAAQAACCCALTAWKTGQPTKMRLPRAVDMITTGKRHEFLNRYRIGYDEQGQILAADIQIAGRSGYSPDLSHSIVDRAMFHADNAYHLAEVDIVGYPCRTDTVSNTAFRGFGGPQGMVMIEKAITQIARERGLDPLDVRLKNLYQNDAGQSTPYHQPIEHNLLPELIPALEQSCHYRERREALQSWNRRNPILKKGLALTPVKFGISFTAHHLNQAGALVHVYTDGSIQVNHGGTEMGQGLYTKVAQVVAEVFQVSAEQVEVTSTRTDKVSNTSPTAASSGADLNGMAAFNAASKIRQRLLEFLCATYSLKAEDVVFSQGQVQLGTQSLSFAEVVQKAYMGRVQLFADGFYKTPDIHFDFDTGRGHPFYYFAYGAACCEVLVDRLTGEYRLEQVDILHDVGASLNPAIDQGQIEGGFVQGAGWLTSEELIWDAQGRPLSVGPATYKIPAIGDVPARFSVQQMPAVSNPMHTIYRSKAVGEPPLMLGIAVWCALEDAIAACADYRFDADLHTPATPEKVLMAIQRVEHAALD